METPPVYSPSKTKTKTYLSTFLNNYHYKSPPNVLKSSLSTSNRKNPLFYSVSKPSSKASPTHYTHNDGLSTKDEDKFHEFKRNLLEELKVLKETNNLMRERNKMLGMSINNGYKKEMEPAWMSDYFDKRSKNGQNQKRLFESYIEKPLKYDSTRNIYSTNNISIHQKNDKNEEVTNLEHDLDLITTVLDFDIKAFIFDLKENSKGKLCLKTNLEIDWKSYCKKNCKLNFVDKNGETKSKKEISTQTACFQDQDRNEKDAENLTALCIKKSEGEQIKNCFETEDNNKNQLLTKKEELLLFNEADSPQEIPIKSEEKELINECLGIVYEQALKVNVNTNSKRKSNTSQKHKNFEKKVANSYLEDLYESVCKIKHNPDTMRQVDEVLLFQCREYENYDSLDTLVHWTMDNLHESLVWVYCKTKLKTLF